MKFLKPNSASGLAGNLVVVALDAPLCEKAIFRGAYGRWIMDEVFSTLCQLPEEAIQAWLEFVEDVERDDHTGGFADELLAVDNAIVP